METSCSSDLTFKSARLRICFRFLIFLFFAFSFPAAWANLEEKKWIFHHGSKSYAFERHGDQRGTPLVCLPELQKQLRFRIDFNPDTFEVRIRKGKSWVRIWTYSEKIEGSVNIKGKDYPFESRLSRSPLFLGAKLCVPIEFGDRALKPILDAFPPDSLPTLQSMSGKDIQVIIDPGHGGNDFGAHRKVTRLQHFREKDFTLQFAKELRDQLAKENVSAALTREGDHFLTLPERSELANGSQAKLFLSLHMNSAESPKASGYELYVLSLARSDAAGRSAVARENQMIPTELPPGLEKAIADLRAEANLERSLKWAHALDEALGSQIQKSGKQSIRMGPFYILYGASMPAVLLEIGYLTSEKDRNWILHPVKRQKLMESLAKKIASTL